MTTVHDPALLASHLHYLHQLQFMHHQRARDIQILHHQQNPTHCLKRYHLAQRMLQLQTLHHQHQIQRILHIQKLHQTRSQPVAPSHPPPTPDKNTLLIPTRPRPSQAMIHELHKVTLPSLDSIRKQRQHRLKYQARLRQSLSQPRPPAQPPALQSPPSLSHPMKSSSLSQDHPQEHKHQHQHQPQMPSRQSTLLSTSSSLQTLYTSNALSVSEPLEALALTCPSLTPSADHPNCPNSTPKNHTLPASAPDDPSLTLPFLVLQRQIHTAVGNTSITSILPRSPADIHYKRQLRQTMALQQYLVRDQTHRYRLYQAYCLLQRARDAQVANELHAFQKKQQQTLAWVQTLRQTSDLAIPE